MQILRSIRLLRRPKVASCPVPMHPLSAPSRPFISFIASPALRWRPPALGRRSFPLMADPNPPVCRACRFSHGPWSTATITFGKLTNILRGKEHSAITIGMKNFNTDNSRKNRNIEMRGTISEVDQYMRSEKDAFRTTSEFIDDPHDALGQNINLPDCKKGQKSATKNHTTEIMVSDDEGYTVDNVLAGSSHRDGSIYRKMDLWWKTDYHIADRNETRTLSDPSDCVIKNGTCYIHVPCPMLQIFSLELTKLPVDADLVKLYGYVAVRDDLEPLLNYVVNY